MKFKSTLLLGLGLLSIQSAQAFVTVGSSGCDYTTIQAAVDSGDQEIRVASTNIYNENISIFRSTGLTIKGGYANCTAAQNNTITATKAIIDAQDYSDVVFLRINGVASTTVSLENLDIKGGNPYDLDQGVGLYVSVHSVGVVYLKNMEIHNNKGGGVYVGNGANVVLRVEDSQISFNKATNGDGGGIYCGGGEVNIYGSSKIIGNSATFVTKGGNGGGIALKNCDLYMYSGYDTDGPVLFTGVLANTADENGGGIYADNSRVELRGYKSGIYGDNIRPALVANNQANKGAGVYAFNNSILSSTNSLVDSNTATNNGGGFYIDDSVLTITRTSNCWHSDDGYGSCSRVRKNKSGNYGGGLYVANGGSVVALASIFNDNRADYGTAAYARDPGSNVTFMNSILFKNGNNAQDGYDDRFVLRGTSSGTINAYHVTMKDNDISDNYTIIGIGSNSVLNLKNSIVRNSPEDVLFVETSPTINADCVFVNENTSISGTHIVTNNPDNVVPIVDTYHLYAPHAPAADYCPAIPEVAGFMDIDGDVRPFDDPTWGNVYGPADAGADEIIKSDIIFKNSFEDGGEL